MNDSHKSRNTDRYQETVRRTYESMSRNRLYRNKKRGILAGVCAGISDWTGINLTALRIIVILLAFPFTAVMLIGYVVLALLLPIKPEDLYRDPEHEEFWQEVRRAPTDTVSTLNHRFRSLDERLQRMEAWLTSREYRINKELDQ
ncbi:MAG: envelope stress response membrane protein PspC [Pseudomonadota bacterium]